MVFQCKRPGVGWGGGVAAPSFRLASSGPGSYAMPHTLLAPGYIITGAASCGVTSSLLTILTLTELVPFLGKAAMGSSE